MSSSNAITERREDRPQPGGWKPFREWAPSVVREDQPTVARFVGGVGLFCIALALIGLLLPRVGGRVGWVGPGWAAFLSLTGLVCLLMHAASEKEQQLRRLYGAFGALWLLAGVVLPLIPVGGPVGTLFGYGWVSQLLGLLFLMAYLRNETEATTRETILRVIGAAGLLLALTAFLLSNVSRDFAAPRGLLLALMGLAYLTVFISARGAADDLSYRAGLAMGALGGLAFAVAAVRSAFAPANTYVMPEGLTLMALGLLYVLFAAALCSDSPVVTMARRELTAYFYSPIAYIVLFGLTVIGWWLFAKFLSRLLDPQPWEGPAMEPIIAMFILDWWPVICVIFVVPVLTMRLLSEERRSGTLEVLLTAPVGEAPVVLSKFLGALGFFLLMWLPWGLYLVALRLIGGEPFDYRPAFSFLIALACTGAGFLAMGLFFSSLTRNQIASAVLTFAGMLALTVVFFVHRPMEDTNPWKPVLEHASYIHLWQLALEGRLVLKYLLFHASAVVFWLFLTVKVLEARKWS